MGTETVYLFRGAYISRSEPTTAHVGGAKLKSSCWSKVAKVWPSPSSLDFTEFKSTDQYYACNHAAVLQFLIPSTLKYKKINSASLTRYTEWKHDITSSGCPYISTAASNCVDVCTAYSYEGDLSNVTWGGVKTVGNLGGSVYTEHPKEDYTYQEGSRWLTHDVSSLFMGALQDDLTITFILLENNVTNNLHYPGSNVAVYGSTSGYYPYLTISYSDVEQLAPTPSYPKDLYLKEGDPILFTWQHNSETKAIQDEYELKYKLKTAATWTTVTGDTEHSYSLPEGLTAGEYEWKIMITNDAGEDSDWSETVSFTVVGRPAVPVINDPVASCLTTISWNTNDQNAFELSISSNGEDIYSFEDASSVAEHKPNIFLANGTYTIGVRYKNSIDLWSDWAYKTFVLAADIPQLVSSSVSALETSIKIDFGRSDEEDHIAIMRSEAGGEFKVIALVDDEETSYEDHTVKSGVQYTYKVREYAEGFSDGYPMSGTVVFGGMVLRADDVEVHLTQSNDKFLAIDESVERESAVLQFSGREFPLVERGEYTDWTLERKFFVAEEQRADLEKIMVKNNAFYRDAKGRAFACALLSCRYQEFMDEGYLATLQLVRTDEEEVVINV